MLVFSCAAIADNPTPSPSGKVADRVVVYTWACQAKDLYRLQIRRATGEVELTSDWRTISPNKGECRFPTVFLDQLRLRAGTLPLNVPFVWTYQSTDENHPWSSPVAFQFEPLTTANFTGAKSDWISYGTGWQIESGTLRNSRGTGAATSYYLWPTSSATAKRTADKEIAVRFRLDCAKDVDCRFGIVLWSTLNKECKAGDQMGCDAGAPPTSWLRFSVSTLGNVTIENINYYGQLVTLQNQHLADIGSLDDAYLRVMWRGANAYRVYLNGHLISCGELQAYRLPNPDAYAAISWQAPAAPLGGSGLEVREVHVLQSPQFTSVFSVTDLQCWLPMPPPFEGWK